MRRDVPGQEWSLSSSEEYWRPESAGRSWEPLSWRPGLRGAVGLLAEVAAGLAGEGS